MIQENFQTQDHVEQTFLLAVFFRKDAKKDENGEWRIDTNPLTGMRDTDVFKTIEQALSFRDATLDKDEVKCFQLYENNYGILKRIL